MVPAHLAPELYVTKDCTTMYGSLAMWMCMHNDTTVVATLNHFEWMGPSVLAAGHRGVA